jgi:outer membrane protein TolC
MRQNIGITGGQLFVSSDLQRIDEFGNIRGHSYMSTPIRIGYRQPMLFYNEYKWEKKIEPLKYKEAKKEYLEALEEATIRGVNHFFQLLLAQKNLEIARTNYANADTLFNISRERFKIGTIAENELMNMKMSLLNAKTERNEARVNLQAAKIRLRSYLGFNETVDIELMAPTQVPGLSIEVSKAIELAKENNPEIINYEKQLLQARQDVAQTKAEKGPNANLFASFGLTQKAEEFANAYQSPQNQQSLRLGLEVPLVDWGLGKGRYRMAQSRQEVIRADIERSKREFEQNVALDVMRFNLQDDQVEVKEQANLTAQQRYEITRKRFLVGKVSVLELNDASRQQDQAKRNYIRALRNYWQDYYEIRRMTLYDFIEQTKLSKEFDELHQ